MKLLPRSELSQACPSHCTALHVPTADTLEKHNQSHAQFSPRHLRGRALSHVLSLAVNSRLRASQKQVEGLFLTWSLNTSGWHPVKVKCGTQASYREASKTRQVVVLCLKRAVVK